MSDEDAFVHSILDDPDDDTSRLVFADWLEEHDRASHAELIRVQCELASLTEADHGSTRILNRRTRRKRKGGPRMMPMTRISDERTEETVSTARARPR